MSNWSVIPAAAGLFPDPAVTATLAGVEINASPMSRLVRVEHGDSAYYVKIYASRGRGMRQVLGRSRVRAEWENLKELSSMGVPTARVIACGEGTDGGRYQGILVTEELRGTRDLAALIDEGHPIVKDCRWRQAVIRRLAEAVQSMHLNRFVHGDLKWRNILVETVTDPKVYVIDCPLGRKLIGPFLSRGIIKDLACLDKLGRRVLRRTERLQFYKLARGRERLDAESRREISRIVSFFDGRD